MRSALVHLVKSCPPSHSSDQRFASCICKVFDGQWPDSGSRFGERKVSKVWSCVHNVVVAENCIRISWHLPHSQVAGEWDVYIDIYGRKLMEKSVDIGQMVGVPFPNECYHLLKDFCCSLKTVSCPPEGPLSLVGISEFVVPAHLRGHVVRCATEGVGRLVEVDLQLAHAKVHDAYVALVVQQEVVQLEVPAKERRVRGDDARARLACKQCPFGGGI